MQLARWNFPSVLSVEHFFVWHRICINGVGPSGLFGFLDSDVLDDFVYNESCVGFLVVNKV